MNPSRKQTNLGFCCSNLYPLIQHFPQTFLREICITFATLLLKPTATINIFHMRVLIIAFLLSVVVWACGGSEQKPAEPAAATQPAVAAEDGEKIYKMYCVVCHGIYGDQGNNGAFNLATSTLTAEERVQVITNGRNTMASFANILDEAKIKAVAEYTTTLKTPQ